MKQHATVLCRRGDRVLLVARPHARWTLPGGLPKPGESLSDAARRELAEETGLVCRNLRYLFRAAGKHKLHHVFLADLDAHARARPSAEVAHCAWFDRMEMASIDCSGPTPAIVELALDGTRGAGPVAFMIHVEAETAVE